jgi:hypothetical protein
MRYGGTGASTKKNTMRDESNHSRKESGENKLYKEIYYPDLPPDPLREIKEIRQTLINKADSGA